MTTEESCNQEFKEKLRDNPIIDEIIEESIFKKLRTYLSRFMTPKSVNTLSVEISKSSSGYGWYGGLHINYCIFAKYFHNSEGNPWGRLDNLLSRGVINIDQRRRFGWAICQLDSKTANEDDLKNLNELASILGMEVNVIEDVSP